jgi:hypothetical protein
MGLRLALDQNFPTHVLDLVHPYLPRDMTVASLHRIDRRLADLGDRALLIALHQLGWHGLITNNYKMLNTPAEIAAIAKTRCVLVAVKGSGHDPIRATGALLLDLPGLDGRLRPEGGNVFLLNHERRQPRKPSDFMETAAAHRGVDMDSLWGEVRVTDAELAQRVLD